MKKNKKKGIDCHCGRSEAETRNPLKGDCHCVLNLIQDLPQSPEF